MLIGPIQMTLSECVKNVTSSNAAIVRRIRREATLSNHNFARTLRLDFANNVTNDGVPSAIS